MREAQVAERFRRACKRLGLHTVKTHGNEYQEGVPDLIVLAPRGVWLVETKGDGTPIRGSQVAFFTVAKLCCCPHVWLLKPDGLGWVINETWRGAWSELEAFIESQTGRVASTSSARSAE